MTSLCFGSRGYMGYVEFVFSCACECLKQTGSTDFDINSHQAPKGYAAAMRKAKILWIESMALVKDMLLRISKPLIQLTNLKSCEIQCVPLMCWEDC